MASHSLPNYIASWPKHIGVNPYWKSNLITKIDWPFAEFKLRTQRSAISNHWRHILLDCFSLIWVETRSSWNKVLNWNFQSSIQMANQSITAGLVWTEHMRTRQPNCQTAVLPDRTKSGLIFLNILHTKYGLSILFR